MDAPFEQKTSIRALHAFNRIYMRSYHRLNVATPCTIPAAGPAVLFCNHISGLDPSLLQATTNRIICWMMATAEIERMNAVGIGGVFRFLQVIPVTRTGQDTAGVRQALRFLKAGRVVGVFPEGKIETTRDLLPFAGGVGLLARRVGAPMIAARLEGTMRNRGHGASYLIPQEAAVFFAPPINSANLPTDERETGKFLRQAVADLAPRGSGLGL